MADLPTKEEWAEQFEDWRWRRAVLGEKEDDPEEVVSAGEWEEIEDEGIDLLFHAAQLIDPTLGVDGQTGATT